MNQPRIYADFHNADAQGRLRLNCVGTLEDLARHNVQLRPGLALTLYADDLNDKGELDELVADGVAAYSEEDACWVAVIDWAAIRHASEIPGPLGNGDTPSSGMTSEKSGTGAM